MVQNKLLIVDGMNLLFQMFFGMPARIVNADGKLIGGTIGFVGALIKMIKMTSPTHAVVIFDGESKNERAALDDNYKANRPDYSGVSEDENPFSQLPDILRALDFLNIKYYETSDCEADDLISGLALKYGGGEVVISSFDSDFFQLITDKVSVLRYRGDNTVICTPEYIKERLGIAPELYAEYKSLTGDTADNIKGADKIGPKTAAALMNEFGSLESLIENAHLIKKPSVRASIEQNAERIRLNLRLIKLGGVDHLPFELDDMAYTYTGMSTAEVLRGIGVKR